jgi:hypothetical protein
MADLLGKLEAVLYQEEVVFKEGGGLRKLFYFGTSICISRHRESLGMNFHKKAPGGNFHREPLENYYFDKPVK